MDAFTPIQIRSHTFKNRFIMGSIHSGLEDQWDGFKRLTTYLERRAEGQVGAIITGGFSPNLAGRVSPFSSDLAWSFQVKKHRRLTKAVQAHGTKIFLQLLHAGRYSYHPWSVAPSKIKSPITPFMPRALSLRGIQKQKQDFVNSAVLAQKAGYDGIELMGSEGYFLHQFLSEHTNQRTDSYGGSLENRMRLPLEIVQAIREKVSPDFLIFYRIPIFDGVAEPLAFADVITFARRLNTAGVDLFNSGIGWHESRIPTIASIVPQSLFVELTEKYKRATGFLWAAVNRINTPELAQAVIENHQADMVSLARPFLADPDFVKKAQAQKSATIIPCIACNQACLDHIFSRKRASCLLNPKAGYEWEWAAHAAKLKVRAPANKKQKTVVVVGSGMAGLAAACELAQKGHRVVLVEKNATLGGQFNLAAQVSGKADFALAIQGYQKLFESLDGKILTQTSLVTRAAVADFVRKQLSGQNPDHWIVATGVKPRKISVKEIPDGTVVMDYAEFFALPKNNVAKNYAGKHVLIVGAGGVAYDVAKTLIKPHSFSRDLGAYLNFWSHKHFEQAPASITLIQRSQKIRKNHFGKTTAWITRDLIKAYAKMRVLTERGLDTLSPGQATLKSVSEKGALGAGEIVACDVVIFCAGQERESDSLAILTEMGLAPVAVGGASAAVDGLNAYQAIKHAIETVRDF